MTTMTIKALTGIAVPPDTIRPGEQYTGEAAEMARWCAAGIAAPVKTTRKKAVKAKSEKAIAE